VGIAPEAKQKGRKTSRLRRIGLVIEGDADLFTKERVESAKRNSLFGATTPELE